MKLDVFRFAVLGTLCACVYLLWSQSAAVPDWSPPTIAATPAIWRDAEQAEAAVIELPDDRDQWATIVFVHQDWQRRPRDVELVSYFDVEPRLVALKHQTKFFRYTDRDPYYVQNFAGTVPELPAVRLQTGRGMTVFQVSGDRALRGPKSLARAITADVERVCPDGRCGPWSPAPDPPDESPPPLQPIPDTLPPQEEPADENRGLISFLLALAGGGFLGLRQS